MNSSDHKNLGYQHTIVSSENVGAQCPCGKGLPLSNVIDNLRKGLGSKNSRHFHPIPLYPCDMYLGQHDNRDNIDLCGTLAYGIILLCNWHWHFLFCAAKEQQGTSGHATTSAKIRELQTRLTSV